MGNKLYIYYYIRPTMPKYSPERYQRYKDTIKRAQKVYASKNPDKMREYDKRSKMLRREVSLLRNINI